MDVGCQVRGVGAGDTGPAVERNKTKQREGGSPASFSFVTIYRALGMTVEPSRVKSEMAAGHVCAEG